MKKIVLITMVTFFAILAGLSHYVTSKIVVENSFHINGNKVYLESDKGKEEINLYGININAGIPGAFPGEENVDVELYLEWFRDISSLGMNSVRVLDLMGEEFYEALFIYNQNNSDKMYLLQGIRFDEIALKYGADPLGKDSRKDFKGHINETIDALYGNPAGKTGIPLFDKYMYNVSDYVVGYCVGPEWQSHDVLYSEIMNNKEVYTGQYFNSAIESSVFEAYIAEMLDYIVTFENKKYGKQPIVSFQGTMGLFKDNIVKSADGRLIEIDSTSEFGLKSIVDAEMIQATQALESGYFVSYNVYTDYSYKDGQVKDIFEAMVDYHSMPVVITEYGCPSSRLATNFNSSIQAYISEEEQADRIIQTLNRLENSNVLGSFLLEYHDSWFKSTWNLVERKVLDSAPYWSDAQMSGQGFGLIAYDPLKDEISHHLDGKLKDWDEEKQLVSNDDFTLSVSSDEKYLHILLQSNGDTSLERSTIEIDFDVTPKSGATVSPLSGEVFERGIDFIAAISSRSTSRLLVQEYYNTYLFEQSIDQLKMRPDIINVQSDMNVFSKIMVDIEPSYIKEEDMDATEEQRVETGLLYRGNSNPSSEEYVSYADYYISDEVLELRVPWSMFNFMDPSNKMIHDDYYNKFNFEAISIDDLYVGATIKNLKNGLVRLNSSAYTLESWAVPTYEKRYKQAFKDLLNRANQAE